MAIVYPWQEKSWQDLTRIRQQGRLPHAIILAGRHGSGIGHFARVLANAVLCQTDQDACGGCRDCHLFAVGNHPDLLLINNQDHGGQIKVDQIRKLIDFISLKGFAGNAKIALIDATDGINPSAANTLLKTLEEPPENSLLFLLSHRPATLPITIRSRCQIVTVQVDINNATLQWIGNQIGDADKQPGVLLELAEGAPLLAVSMQNSGMLEAREKVINQLLALLEHKVDPIEAADYWNSIGCREIIAWVLRVNQAMIRYKLCGSIENSMLRAVKTRLHHHVKRLNLLQLAHSYAFILGQYRLALSPVSFNSLGLLEELTIYWQSRLAEK